MGDSSHISQKSGIGRKAEWNPPPISIAADLDLAAREQGEGSNLSSPDTISERNVVHDIKLDGLDGDVGHVSLNEVNGDEEDLGIDFTCSPSHSVNDTRARHMSDDRIERKGVTTKESQ